MSSSASLARAAEMIRVIASRRNACATSTSSRCGAGLQRPVDGVGDVPNLDHFGHARHIITCAAHAVLAPLDRWRHAASVAHLRNGAIGRMVAALAIVLAACVQAPPAAPGSASEPAAATFVVPRPTEEPA